MLTLFSYPELFGVADKNPYGLRTFAFLRLTNVPFRHEHIFDASSAPRGQLPYIEDDSTTIGDSDAIIAHLINKYDLAIDAELTPSQFAMEGPAILAPVSRCVSQSPSAADPCRDGRGTDLQLPALSLSGNRPL